MFYNVLKKDLFKCYDFFHVVKGNKNAIVGHRF